MGSMRIAFGFSDKFQCFRIVRAYSQVHRVGTPFRKQDARGFRSPAPYTESTKPCLPDNNIPLRVYQSTPLGEVHLLFEGATTMIINMIIRRLGG